MSFLNFNWNNQQNALSALTDQLNHKLVQHGFQRKEKREWERDQGWIVEGIYLSVKQAPSWVFDPHLIVYLPYHPADANEPRVIFAQTNAAKFIGRDSAYIRLPKYSFFISRFVRNTLKEIEESLAWFEKFDTPEKCFAMVDDLHKPGCSYHIWSKDYFASILK